MIVLLWQLWGVGPARVEGEGERGDPGVGAAGAKSGRLWAWGISP